MSYIVWHYNVFHSKAGKGIGIGICNNKSTTGVTIWWWSYMVNVLMPPLVYPKKLQGFWINNPRAISISFVPHNFFPTQTLP